MHSSLIDGDEDSCVESAMAKVVLFKDVWRRRSSNDDGVCVCL